MPDDPTPAVLRADAEAAFDAWADLYDRQLATGHPAYVAAATAAARRLLAAERAARAADPSFHGYTT